MPLISPGELARMGRVLGNVANAQLTKIETPGTLSISGDPTGWVTAWSGSAPGFLSRVHRETKDGGHVGGAQVDIEAPEHKDEFTFLDGVTTALADAGPDWQGSRVTIIDERTAPPVTSVRTVVEMEHQAYGLLDSARLVLDPAGR